MTDERLKILAHNLVNYSCRVGKGEKVLIEVFDAGDEVAEALIAAVYEAGGVPFCQMHRPKVQRALLMGLGEEQVRDMTRWDSERMKAMDCYISFRGNDNANELSDVPGDKMRLYQSVYSKQVHSDLRVKGTKWVVLRYPNSAMAQLSGMSTRAFEDYYFNVCNLDYGKMDAAMTPLKELMERTDRVRLVSPGTDLAFSIKGIPAVKCAGHMNVPDGEVYTAPVADSIDGEISFNVKSPNDGFTFENIRLVFQKGRIVEATANDTERLNHILDTDEGARGVGEFSLGVNPYITSPMGDILFDEKITGSIHFTPGSCYDDAYNGNRSAVHWDMVLIQTPEWGGGQIYFDDVLIREDGRFVIPELEALNPENLK